MGAGEYRALLEAMMREQGDRSGYSFVKENLDTDQPEVHMSFLDACLSSSVLYL